MKFTLALATFVAIVYGQTINDVPPCAIPCIQTSIAKVTKCDVNDFACACKSFDAIETDSVPCVVSACGADVAINQVLPAVQAICAAQ